MNISVPKKLGFFWLADPNLENGVWRIEYNDELYGLYTSGQVKMATTFSDNGGELTLQEDNLLPA
jgi:hypothetical protein